jgi:4-hydroxy-tetrahydrodipicolinate reductase
MDPYPGTHEILYSSKEDEIEIRHTAKNRNGFAQGAIFAAEYLLGKKGVYTMNDLINFSL